MAKNDIHKTGITPPIGLYEYNMMPFGLRNASNTSQRYMDQVSRGLEFGFVYVDDVLIASHSVAKHEFHLRTLLDRFRKFGVVLNSKKCVIGASEFTFLGHLINSKGLLIRKPIPKKIEAIQDFPQSKTMKQLRRFLGMINFYRRFIPACAETLHPLNQLLSPAKHCKKSVLWSPEAEEAFSAIKAKLSNSTLLSFPSPSAETALFIGASQTGCGPVLQQRIQGAWHLLSFFSDSFNRAQSRYATFDRGLLGIYLAIRHFRYFIEGQSLPLTSLFVTPYSPGRSTHHRVNNVT